MNTNELSKSQLIEYLEKGMSSRDIEKETGIKYWNILYYIKKYELNSINRYKKLEYNEDFFSKIDTKEKAYILGFFLGDGHITKDDKFVLNIKLDDKEILDFICSNIGGHYIISNNFDKTKKIFPHGTIKFANPKIIKDLKKLFGGKTKEERHIPIISKHLESYLVQGFFDAEGCITWGHRKDRDRIWQKVSFTSQYKMLYGIQQILIKNNISTSIRPKCKEKCFIMENSNKKTVIDLLNYIYSDDNFIILKRKYENQIALRLELGEFGESLTVDTEPSLQSRKV